jgi:hypothetical protein
LSAGNCFSDKKVQTNAENTTTISGSFYYTKDGYQNLENCKNPGEDAAFLSLDSDSERGDVCSNLNVLSNYSPSLRKCEFEEGMTLIEKLTELADEIDAINNNDELNPHIKNYLLKLLRRCLESLFDGEGNILWERKMGWLDIAQNTFVISGDTLVIAGNHNPAQEEFYLHYRSLSGDSIATHTIFDTNQLMTSMFALGLSEFDNKYILTGTGRDTSRASLIYSIHKDGTLDTLLAIDRTDANTSAFGMSVDSDGHLNIAIEKNTLSVSDYRDYRKYDKNWNIVWNFTTDPISGSYLESKTMAEVEEDAMVYTNLDFWGDNYIYKVDSSGQELWSYQFGAGENKIGASIMRLKTTREGDIIGGGWWFDSTDEYFPFFIDRVPFIFKMSTDGELIWQKAIVEKDTLLFERAIAGIVNDLIELDDGDILAVGRWGLPDRKKMVIRLDSDGCIKEQCGDHFDVTPTEDISLQFNVILYPNPVIDNQINVRGLIGNTIYSFTLLDIHGRVILEQGLRTITDLTSIQIPSIVKKGVYLLKIQDRDGRSETMKFVKN